jgi:hypothetical protein
VRKSPPAPLSAVSPGADEDAAVCGAVPTPLPRAADSQPTRRLRWTSARSARWVSRPRRGYASSRRSRQQQAAGSRLQVELGKGTGEGAVQGCECIFHLQMHTVSSLGELSFRIDQSPTPGMCTGQTRSARGSARRRARDSCDRRNCLVNNNVTATPTNEARMSLQDVANDGLVGHLPNEAIRITFPRLALAAAESASRIRQPSLACYTVR